MRFAVFVDAGYLYAAGASAIHGEGGTNRANLELNHPSMIAKLEDLSKELTRDTPLLRIYWYDGILQGQRSQAQQELAAADNLKVRLGTVSGGRQKGVDSLIVTDLIELARNHAISDAVLLSGMRMYGSECKLRRVSVFEFISSVSNLAGVISLTF